MQLLGEDYYEDEEEEGKISDIEPVDKRIDRHRTYTGCMGDDSSGGDAPGSSQIPKKKKKKKGVTRR